MWKVRKRDDRQKDKTPGIKKDNGAVCNCFWFPK